MLDACSIIGLGRVRRRCEGRDRGAPLEVGCGTAVHLTALAPAISRVIETDIYSRDDPCRIAACASPHRHRFELRVDPAEELRTVDDDCDPPRGSDRAYARSCQCGSAGGGPFDARWHSLH